MAPYESWNILAEEDELDLVDLSSQMKDVILFCIDAASSMQDTRPDTSYDESSGAMESNLLKCLESAILIMKKKVIVGPSDQVGVMLFNTNRRGERKGGTSEIKDGCFLLQPIGPISAPTIKSLMTTVERARLESDYLRTEFPPRVGRLTPIGDVFISCNWVIHDAAPKTANKRIFIMTDNDDPHATYDAKLSERLLDPSKSTLKDLRAAGVKIEPFFIFPFQLSKFYGPLLQIDEDSQDDEETTIANIGITRVQNLLEEMRFYELPKRSLFSIPFKICEGLTIGIKGYGLVTEQKKGAYKYFVDTGGSMEVVNTRTLYIDKETKDPVDKSSITYGIGSGGAASAEAGEEMEDDTSNSRVVPFGTKPFYTADEIKEFRTFGLEPQLKLLGFKPKEELNFWDNIKHSYFIHPDEIAYSGSRRTFTALLQSMLKKGKIALALSITRRNSTPTFCYLLPQEEIMDGGDSWMSGEPGGFHIIPLPFADDIREAPLSKGYRADEEMTDLAFKWISKLNMPRGYDADAFPNPALAYHNAQLEATAFDTEFDADSFEDLTIPNYKMIQKRAGSLIKDWKDALKNSEAAEMVVVPETGSKRKVISNLDDAEIRSRYDAGTLSKLTNDMLKAFLKSKSLPTTGKKADFLDRIENWIERHQ